MANLSDSDISDLEEEFLVSGANQRQDNTTDGAPLIFGQTLGARPALHDPTKLNVVLSVGDEVVDHLATAATASSVRSPVPQQYYNNSSNLSYFHYLPFY